MTEPAIETPPNFLQQAITAHQAGLFGPAERLYMLALKQNPRNADALALLGVALSAQGKHNDAMSVIEQAVDIDPGSALFRFHQGNILGAAGKLIGSSIALERAVEMKPDFIEAIYNLANVRRALGDWMSAIKGYRNVLVMKPEFAEAYNNLALSLVHEKEYEEALGLAKRVVEIAPNYGEGWRTLCNIAEQAKDYPLALVAGERCIRLMPDHNTSWFGYAVVLNRLDRHEEAIEAYRKALTLQPDRVDIWDNLAQTYQSLNQLDMAEATFRKTLEIAGQVIDDEDEREVKEHEYGNRHWHLALIELLRGKLKSGFARYRSRFHDVAVLKRPDFSRPLWQGEKLKGKTILITDEQGFGDTLMFCRYLPLLKKQGAKVIFSVHPVLESLFRDWDGKDQLIIHNTRVPAYDFHASIFDLPYRFGTELSTIPADVPYLPVLPPDEKTTLPAGTKKKIGLVWGGSPVHTNDSKRSVPLKLLTPLVGDVRFDFYSFNRDMKEGDEELLPALPITNLTPRIKNFADAARLIGQMDLLITCDTATAHLAGGLGRPVWIMLPFAPDWRWLTEREDSPWYPTAQLFRQSHINDWAGVVDKLRDKINTLI